MHIQLCIQQTQKLIMTPKLKQAIEILQYSREELLEKINDELISNPILDVKEETTELKQLISHFSSAHDVKSSGSYKKDEEIDSMTYMQHFSDVNCSLNEYLERQLQVSSMSNEEREIGCTLLDYFDQDGYLNGNIEKIAFEYEWDQAIVEKVLKVIQTFDPSGVGSRNLQECLLIQFDSLPLPVKKTYGCIENIIKEHLYDLGNRKYAQITKALHISDEKLREAIHIIQGFSPKPGSCFDKTEKVEYIVPDITVKEIEGEFFILHDTSCYPHLRVNQYYLQLLESNKVDDKSNKYIKEKMDAALWLVKNIEHRHYIVYQIMEKIIYFQEQFFKYGPKYLKPLNLKDISQVIGVHESTVSRAVRNKYVNTKWGIFDLKYFFPGMINKQDGELVSNEVIKQMIKDFIDKENPKKPYSDQKLVNILQEKNIKVSRRTIAKYRNEMGIACSNHRKSF